MLVKPVIKQVNLAALMTILIELILKQEGGVIARAGTDSGRVADDERRGQAAVKGLNLILAVGGVGHGRPHGAVPVPAAGFPQRTDGKNGFLVPVVLGHFRRCAVV